LAVRRRPVTPPGTPLPPESLLSQQFVWIQNEQKRRKRKERKPKETVQSDFGLKGIRLKSRDLPCGKDRPVRGKDNVLSCGWPSDHCRRHGRRRRRMILRPLLLLPSRGHDDPPPAPPFCERAFSEESGSRRPPPPSCPPFPSPRGEAETAAAAGAAAADDDHRSLADLAGLARLRAWRPPNRDGVYYDLPFALGVSASSSSSENRRGKESPPASSHPACCGRVGSVEGFDDWLPPPRLPGEL